jgi:hypothetical protein
MSCSAGVEITVTVVNCNIITRVMMSNDILPLPENKIAHVSVSVLKDVCLSTGSARQCKM